MEIVIDFNAISTSPFAFAWWFFKTIGWTFPVFLFIYGLILYWQFWIRNKYRKEREYILLAIDVPKDNEQGPKAVENIFNQLAGAHQPLKIYEKWWTGEIPDNFSFEIVSLGGYIQFIIHCERKYRDLIEAIIYAQYPDAEIIEVDDYTKNFANIKFPNEKYQLWGTELKLAKKQYYPIRTHPEFEHVAEGAEGYKDSMAGILESLTRIGPGEQIWIQIVTTPADNDWGEGAKPIIKKLAGARSEGSKGIFGKISSYTSEFEKQIFATPEGTTTTKKDEPPTLLLYLTQGEKDIISGIEHKIGKIGFHTKIRLIYLAEKEKFNKPVAKAIYGGFKQFNTLDLNSFKPDTRTLTGGIVWFKKMRVIARQNKILYKYRYRGHWLEPGYYGYILNNEELASVYHFPVLAVKAPLVKKIEAKKAEPPMSLPIEGSENPTGQSNISTAEPPQNLPTV